MTHVMEGEGEMPKESEIGDEQIHLDVDEIYVYPELSPGYPTIGRGLHRCCSEREYVNLNIRTPSAYFGMKPTKALNVMCMKILRHVDQFHQIGRQCLQFPVAWMCRW